jgi:phage shock protein C
MKSCSSCNTINPEGANFCQECGAKLDLDNSRSTFNENMDHFEEEIEDFGKKIESSFENVGKRIETWYDKTFGIFGPVLSAIIALVILFIVINALSFFGSSRPWMQEISGFLESLVLLFLVIFLLSSYSEYFTRKLTPFRFISPIIGAIIFIVWFWVAINILTIIATAFELSMVQSISDLFEALIFPLAILILLIGYIGVITSTKKDAQSNPIPHQKGHSKSLEHETMDTEGYKRLYRSGKDQLVGGVLGGLAEYLKVDPTIIRVLYILLLFASFGFMILAYLIGWMLIPRNPNHKW